jgi:hypothetical protein
MPGRPMRKVFCQGFTRAGLRKGLKIPCKMKGLSTCKQCL